MYVFVCIWIGEAGVEAVEVFRTQAAAEAWCERNPGKWYQVQVRDA